MKLGTRGTGNSMFMFSMLFIMFLYSFKQRWAGFGDAAAAWSFPLSPIFIQFVRWIRRVPLPEALVRFATEATFGPEGRFIAQAYQHRPKPPLGVCNEDGGGIMSATSHGHNAFQRFSHCLAMLWVFGLHECYDLKKSTGKSRPTIVSNTTLRFGGVDTRVLHYVNLSIGDDNTTSVSNEDSRISGVSLRWNPRTSDTMLAAHAQGSFY